jgi:NitT/TauT family transport system substrate-binding protein
MKMLKYLIVGLLAVVIILAGCTTKQQETVKAGFVPAAYYLPFYVAIENGYFEEEGLQLEKIDFGSVSNQVNALIHGDIDITALGSGGGFPLEARQPNQFDYIYGQNSKSYAFLVKKNSKINEIKDLERKRIGTWPSPTSTTFIKLITKKYFNENDYTLVPLDYKFHPSALDRGDVDALYTYDVAIAMTLNSDVGEYLAENPLEDEVLNPFFNGGAIISTKTDPAKAEKIKRAMDKAVLFTQQNPEESRRILSKIMGIDLKIAKEAPVDEFKTIGQLDMQKVQEVADILHDEGLMEKPIEIEDIFYDEK